jgi:hypothetical protein
MHSYQKLSSFILAIALLSSAGYARTKVDSYKSILESWGIYSNAEKAAAKNISPVYKIDLASTIAPNKTLNADTLRNVHEIVICDQDITVNNTLVCNYGKVFLSQPNASYIKFGTTQEGIQFYKYYYNGREAYLIPEEYFITPTYLSLMEKQFRGIANVDGVNGPSTQLSYQLATQYLNRLTDDLTTTLTLLLILFLINSSWISKYERLQRNVHALKENIAHNKYLIFLTALVSITVVLLLSAATYISLRINGLIDFNGVYAQLVTKLETKAPVLSFLIQYKEPILICLGYAVAAFFIFRSGLTLKRIKDALTCKLFRTKPNKAHLRTIRYLLFLAAIVLVGFCEIDMMQQNLLFLIPILAFTTCLANQGEETESITTTGTSAKTLILGAALVVSIMLNKYYNSYESKHASTALVDASNNNIFLPIAKQLNHEMVRDYYSLLQTELFVNSYMVYYPGVTTIHNMPLADIAKIKPADNQNMFVIAESGDNLYQYITEHSQSLGYFTNATPTHVLYIPGATNPFAKYTLQINFTCNQKVGPQTIYAVIHTKGFANTQKEELLNFPGCKALKPTETYEVPLLLQDSQEPAVIDMTLPKNVVFSSIFVVNETGQQVSQYITGNSAEHVCYQRLGTGDAINVYSLDTKKPFTVTRDSLSNKPIDIATYINDLQETRSIDQNIVVWSNMGVVPFTEARN